MLKCDETKLITRGCPVCNETNFQHLLFKKGFTLVSCRNCGMFYISNSSTTDTLVEIYNEDYFTGDVYSKYEFDTNYENSHAGKRDIALIKKVQRFTPASQIVGKILDVGCGPGYFLRCAKKMGYDCHGVEISKWASEYASKTEGLKIFNGELHEAEYNNDFFDVVNSSHVLEHVLSPLSLLKEVYRILKQDGIAVITIPTEPDSLVWKYGKIEDCINVPAHINYFTKFTILRLLKEIGFNIYYTKRVFNFFYNYNYFFNRNNNKQNENIAPSVENYYKNILELSNLKQNLFYKLKNILSISFGLFGIGDELIMFMRK